VSPVTGAGIDALKAALGRLAAAMPSARGGPTRLWIDRAFTVSGAGTVVTGTLGSGSIAVGDELLLAPSGRAVRVRGLQSLKESVPQATAVARLAVNLRGVKLNDVHRGQALVTSGAWAPVSTVDVRLVRPAPRLPGHLVLHVGSAAVPVRIRCFDADSARLDLASAVPMHVGERAVLRDPGEHRIAAGVLVLDTLPPPLRRRGAAAHRAKELAEMSHRPDPVAEVRRHRAVRRVQLVAAGVLGPDQACPPEVITAGDWLVEPGTWSGWGKALLAALDRWALANPLSPGMPREAAAREAGLVDPRLLDPLIATMSDVVCDADGVHRPDAAANFPPNVMGAFAEIRQQLGAEPFAAPEAGELTALGLSERHLAAAVKAGVLMRVDNGVFLLPDAPAEAARRVAVLEQPFTLSEARQALHTTRRVAVPLFELLDRRGVTRRVDGGRRILCLPVEDECAPHPPPAVNSAAVTAIQPIIHSGGDS
jgi:selenocysteine-specific elongation factor